MFCKKCGSEYSEDAVYCNKCGLPTESSASAPVSDGLLIAGYLCAFIIPLIGLILGIIVTSKGSTGHGIAIIISTLLMCFSLFFCLGTFGMFIEESGLFDDFHF